MLTILDQIRELRAELVSCALTRREWARAEVELDWRSAAAYTKTASLPLSGWAWEFLRRNPDYRAALRAVPASPEGRAAIGRNWGLCCRRGP